MKNFLRLFLPITLFLILAGCVALEEEEAVLPEGESIKVGAILPLSGDGATYGIPVQRVAQITLDEVNAAGGVAGKKLEFIWEDGGCSSDMGNRAATKLVDVDKVKLIYGGFCSSETLAAAPIVEKNKVVLLSPGSSSPLITTAGDFVFRNYPSDSTQGQVLAEYAAKKGYKKVGVIAEQQDYTLGIRDAFEKNFKEKGGTVLTEAYLSDASDFRTQILKLKAEEVDVYFINPQTPAKTDLIFKQLQEAQIQGPFMANDVVFGYQKLITDYKDFIEGMVGAESTYDRENPGMAKLQETYKTKYNEELPYLVYMATSYDAVYVIKEAIEAVGYDAEKIRDYLYGIKDRKGLSGSLTIDKNGDPMAGHVLRVVKAGKVEDYKE